MHIHNHKYIHAQRNVYTVMNKDMEMHALTSVHPHLHLDRKERNNFLEFSENPTSFRHVTSYDAIVGVSARNMQKKC